MVDDDCDTAGGKGTGGTPLMEFLKPLRDNCVVSRINSSMSNMFQSVASTQGTQASDYSPLIEKISEEGIEESEIMWRGYKVLPNKCPAARVTMGHTRNIIKNK